MNGTKNVVKYFLCIGTAKYKKGNLKTVYYGTKTIPVLRPKLRVTLPDKYKNSTSLKEFKSEIKNWVALNCPCCLCKTYIQNVGFI